MQAVSIPDPKTDITAKPVSQLGTILALFMILRLVVQFFYTPQGLFNNYTDFYHYYRAALLSEKGFYTFINMWYEYPPILAYWVTEKIISQGGVESLSYQFFTAS